MSALQAFDDWADQLDDRLAGVYDPATLQAIDSASGEPVRRLLPHTAAPPPGPATPAAGWRGGVAAGAMVVGLVQGVRDVLDDDESDPVVEIDEEARHRRLEPVTVHLAWGNPAASVAIVRPWLLS